jgi:hypothetical protein
MRKRDRERRYLQQNGWIAVYDVIYRFVNKQVRSKSRWKWINPRFNGAFSRQEAMQYEERRQKRHVRL